MKRRSRASSICKGRFSRGSWNRSRLIPPAHGFVKGRSIKTFVAPHAGRRVVLRMDVRDFFPSFTAARIQAFFRTAGYPEQFADLLGGICTNVAPIHLWHQLGEMREIYSRRHLPQGAPSSPALANISFWRIDRRLAGLAVSAGAAYTRYADDLAFPVMMPSSGAWSASQLTLPRS